MNLRLIAAAGSLLGFLGIASASDTPTPNIVSIPGNYQSESGCSNDWDPACTANRLSYDETDDVWQNLFTIPSGNWEYKVALNDNWAENYGLNARRDGPNIPLNLTAETAVKFYYDPLGDEFRDGPLPCSGGGSRWGRAERRGGEGTTRRGDTIDSDRHIAYLNRVDAAQALQHAADV